ncbi:hypothetical protein BXY41_109122 [Lacrimispora xylanisolvens]|uniref:Uncharacterized protein n=1 Tax=Lacrimispora xylanisolvens TaxID=384636 RepID=A0A2S6HPZ0_9FIRM|nr:hypothetical protein [Hungatella xylanolytica]PPK79644.1 hypothetical protein BXY41_109122 [Hungatella xylanolytica]
MNQVIIDVNKSLNEIPLSFIKKPIIIGGMAMEYYGMRKAGRDMDLIISQEDYHVLSEKYPDNKKDLYGDLGLIINKFEIWRSIALIDYDFFLKDAIDEGTVLIVSIDRLLWMRVCAMEVEKYKKDLGLMKEYYYGHFRNQCYLQEYRLNNPTN